MNQESQVGTNSEFFYKYNGIEKRCWIVEIEFEEINKEFIKPTGKVDIIRELPKITQNSFRTVFAERNKITLTIEELTIPEIIEAVLRNVKQELETIQGWPEEEKVDYGTAIWNEKNENYELKWGMPKIFRVYQDSYDKSKDLYFHFDFQHHLVWKDKDKNRGWYWYRWDYLYAISKYIFNLLSPHIKKEAGEIVLIPGEQGEGLVPWEEVGYQTNYEYYEIYDSKEEYEKEELEYDFAYETKQTWEEVYGKPALVLSFLPTQIETKRPKKKRLTGTKWVKKLWEVFGKHGVPMVIKCYPGFIYKQLYTNYREIYDAINAFTQLPRKVSDAETGSSNLLVYWNCPWLGDNARTRVKWDSSLNEPLTAFQKYR